MKNPYKSVFYMGFSRWCPIRPAKSLGKCARSCAVLRNFLRTRLEAASLKASSVPCQTFCGMIAQLLAQHGHLTSETFQTQCLSARLQ